MGNVYSFLAGKSTIPDDLTVKVFCQVKDDSDIIEDWIKWHGFLFGFDNVVVIADNPSAATDNVLQRYSSAIALLQAPLQAWPDSLGWDEKKTENLTVAMKQFAQDADFLVPLDSDEFVAFEGLPDKASALREFNRLSGMRSMSFKFYKEYHACTLCDTVDRPAVDITTFRIVKPSYHVKKCFARAKGFERVGLGQHYIYTEDSRESPLPTRLALIHFSWRGLQQMRRKCLQNAQGEVILPDGTIRVPRGAASQEYLVGAQCLKNGTFLTWAKEHVGTPSHRITCLAALLLSDSR